MVQIKENEPINLDAIIWTSIKKSDMMVTTSMTSFQMPFKSKPTELGHKYNILLFRSPEDVDTGMFSAIIGDPEGYVKNIGRLGYNGIMIKQKLMGKKLMKEFFSLMLQKWGFTETQIKKAIKIEG